MGSSFAALIISMLMLLCSFTVYKGSEVKKEDITDNTHISETESTSEKETEGAAEKEEDQPLVQTGPVFNTENITRISFDVDGPWSRGDVPPEHMEEIINWLGTFRIEKVFDEEFPPPGTNALRVEIEYADGTVIDAGVDVMVINGTPYYLKSDKEPDCVMEIISKLDMAW